jgi:hypothetical protein
MRGRIPSWPFFVRSPGRLSLNPERRTPVAYPNPPPPPIGGCIFRLAMIAVMAICGLIMLVSAASQ